MGPVVGDLLPLAVGGDEPSTAASVTKLVLGFLLLLLTADSGGPARTAASRPPCRRG